MGHQDVLGVEGGLLVGWKGRMGRGRDADQRLQRKGVAEQATGGSETVDATKGQRGQGISPCLAPLQDISLYTGFFKVPRPCERAEWATKTSWESREGFSSGGRGEWAGAEMPTSVSRGRGWPSR